MPKSRKNTIFDTVMMRSPKTSSFDLSHNKIFSLDMGKLVPTLCMEVLPGDKININSENFLRFAPLVSPVMHQINVKTYTFFVPNRLLWTEWEDWITGNSEVEAPYITGLTEAAGWTSGCMADYMGIPASSVGHTTQKISPFALAAYYKVYDEYFRDQNLVNEKFVPLTAGDNSTAYLPLAISDPEKKAWEHDYFTSCLPFAQKGDEVTLPLTTDDDLSVKFKPWGGIPQSYPQLVDATTGIASAGSGIVGNATQIYKDSNSNPLALDPNGTLVAEANNEASSINTLRRAFRLQEWLERNARGGTRYIESILSHFGVRSSDKRLQRPEYIGMSKQVMRISEVLSTAQTIDQDTNDVPVGNLAGHGISIGAGNNNNFYAEEHGFILSFMVVIPKTSYYQGLHRMHQRFDRLDYAWPSFANIGEQEVKVKELRNDVGTEADLNETFGYIPRYSEYKFMNSGIAGDMRNNLEFWHLARKWELDDLPALNQEFIEASPDKRIFAVTDENIHSIYAQVFHNIKAVRRLPKFGIPTI